MANPLYITEKGRATDRLKLEMSRALEVYKVNLRLFCQKYGLETRPFEHVADIFLTGFHASPDSVLYPRREAPINLALVNPVVLPGDASLYKREVLDNLLLNSPNDRCPPIDLWHASADYQVNDPRFNVTPVGLNALLRVHRRR